MHTSMDSFMQKGKRPNRRRPICISLYIDADLYRRFILLRKFGVTTTSLLLRGAELQVDALIKKLDLQDEVQK